jgi:Icc-related predicted phosphoesterase
MRILAFSDWRVQSICMINSIIQNTHPDSILYAGDDLKRVIPMESDLYLKTKHNFTLINEETINDKKLFVVNEKNLVLFKDYLSKVILKESINTENIPFFFVNGNDDGIIQEKGKYFIKISPPYFQKDFKNVHIVETPKHKITTKNQSEVQRAIFERLDFDENTLDFSNESEIQNLETSGLYRQLKINPSFGQHNISNDYSFYGFECKTGLNTEISNAPIHYSEIYLSHLPPLGCLDLSNRHGTRHIGSEKLLALVKKFSPKFLICGHSHFWGGKSIKIFETEVINISSNDNLGAPGNYVLIDTETGKYELRTLDFKSLRQVRGAYFKSEENFKIYGGGNVTYDHNLLENDNESIIKSLELNDKRKIAERIRSISWEKPKIIKKLSFNPEDYTLIDIETGLYERTTNIFGERKITVWLIGMLHKGHLVQFEYPAQKKEFINFLKLHNISDLVSWTKFDSKILSKIRELNKIKWHDACQRTTHCIIWHSYKLHELYNLIFNKTDVDIIDGCVAGIYANHLIIKNKECEYCPSIEDVKNQIKERNKKDLLQMFELCDYLWKYKSENVEN